MNACVKQGAFGYVIRRNWMWLGACDAGLCGGFGRRPATCLNGEGHCSATCFEVWETPGGEKTRSHAAGNLHGSSLLYEVTREGFEPPTQ